MKIFKSFRFLTFFSTLLLLCTLSSCSNEYEESFQDNAKVNEIEFRIPSQKNVNKKGSSIVGELSIEDFLNYVYFDGIPSMEFMKKHNVDSESFIELIQLKESYFEPTQANPHNNYITFSDDDLTLEEIRDAMIKECENGYCCFLDDACALAVKIAYHYKKAKEKDTSVKK